MSHPEGPRVALSQASFLTGATVVGFVDMSLVPFQFIHMAVSLCPQSTFSIRTPDPLDRGPSFLHTEPHFNITNYTSPCLAFLTSLTSPSHSAPYVIIPSAFTHLWFTSLFRSQPSSRCGPLPFFEPDPLPAFCSGGRCAYTSPR